MSYRAWGALKHAEYIHGGELDMSYNSALLPTHYEVSDTGYSRGSDYTYYEDRQLKSSEDLADDRFDRMRKYNATSKLTTELSGFEARGISNPDSSPIVNRPYKQTYEYDTFGNQTGGNYRFWRTDMGGTTKTFVNNREVNSLGYGYYIGKEYDADGKLLYQAANSIGQVLAAQSSSWVGNATIGEGLAWELTSKYDGNGDIGKRDAINRNVTYNTDPTPDVLNTTETTTYYVRSSVLGGKSVVDVKPDGTAEKQNVFVGKQLIAEHVSSYYNIVEHDALTGEITRGGYTTRRTPNDSGDHDPWLDFEEPQYTDLQPNPLDMFGPEIHGADPFVIEGTGGCEKDGMPYDCSQLQHEADNGNVLIDVGFSNGAHRYFKTSGIFWGHSSIHFDIPAGWEQEMETEVRIMAENDEPSPDVPEAGGHWTTTESIDVDIPTGRMIGKAWHGRTDVKDKKNSCKRFVDAVEKLLNDHPNRIASDFVNLMYERFANSGPEFGSDGFKTPFQDPSPGSNNQARHYSGGLFAGFQLGATAGLVAANAREDKDRVTTTRVFVFGIGIVPVPTMLPENASQKADKALNAVSTKHGGALADESIKPYEIGGLIAREVCE